MFKKGKSRSKRLNPDSEAATPKRRKINRDYRTNRIGELEERIKDLSDHIDFKVKRRDSASNMKNYKECDRLTEQLSELKADRRQLERELSSLVAKDKKSKWYYKKREGQNPLVCRSPESAAYEVASSVREVTSPTSASSSSFTTPSPRSTRLMSPRTPSDGESTSTYSRSSHTPISPRLPTSPRSDSHCSDGTVILSSDEEPAMSSNQSSEQQSRQNCQVPILRRTEEIYSPGDSTDFH